MIIKHSKLKSIQNFKLIGKEGLKMNNVVSLVGRLTRDIRVYQLDNNKKVAKFNLAVRSLFKVDNNQYKTDFIACSIWGKGADMLEEFGHKGLLIGIEGRLQSNIYINKYNKQIYSLWVNVEKFHLLEWKNKAKFQSTIDSFMNQPSSPAFSSQPQQEQLDSSDLDNLDDLPF